MGPPPPPGAYDVLVAPFAPNPIVLQNSATATVTVSPANGFSGTISLACGVSGGGTPGPGCSFQPGNVAVSGGSGTSTLTVNTVDGMPNGTYTIVVTGQDENGKTPSGGPKSQGWTVQRPQQVGNVCPFGTCDISTPIFMNVFWDSSPGQWDSDAALTPGLREADIEGFTSALIASPYFAGLMQYHVNSVSMRPGITVGSCGAVPTTIDQALSEMGRFADCVMALVNDPANFPSGNAVLNVFLPPQTMPASPTADFCAKFAGEHDKFGSSVEVTVIPTNSRCNGNAAGVFLTLSHEMVESATDPLAASPTGWKQPFGNEIGDICEGLQATPFLNGLVAQYWSNAANNCITGVRVPAARLVPTPVRAGTAVVRFTPHALSPCRDCATTDGNKTVIWTAGDKLAEEENYVGTSGPGAEALLKKLEVLSLSLRALTDDPTKTRVAVRLQGNAAPSPAEIVGPAINIAVVGSVAGRSAKLDQDCTISLALPIGTPESSAFHIVRVSPQGVSQEWEEVSPTEFRGRARVAISTVTETGTYVLVRAFGQTQSAPGP